MVTIDIIRQSGDFGFEATDAAGHTVRMDTSPEGGGNNYGVRPMQMVLMGLGGCSGIDVVSILKKQRQEITYFSMHIEAERETGKEPHLWKSARIVFTIGGNIDEDKAKRAAQLSMEKYCSVAETLRRSGTEISWEVRLK
ncbi:OsmC family protein [Flavihumibacter profundi]|uniref:OsmC family protein n=1 Tax=Flavihumibacter profundi TaxID=2716883 RepID=UPI001CC5835E|nr:OsmC family protein [Flavihumibacter profundi]MBZ5857345.1 OsmC family protein [Flavihumibacter profundi]